jgi:D-3-phosphoglycerate dehydrogenase
MMNDKIKILTCAPLDPVSRKQLEEFGEVTLAGWGGPEGMRAAPLTPEQLVDYGKGKDAIILGIEAMPADVLERLDTLKILLCARAGVESVDIQKASELGIPVLNSPGRNAIAVADFTVGLLLALVRKIPRAETFLHSGGWKTWSSPADYGLEGRELSGRTLGIVGLGMIGCLVAKRAAGFDMKLLGFDPYVNPDVTKDTGISLIPLEELLAKSDFITLHCTLTPETKNMLNSERLGLVRSDAYIVNTARAALIEEEPFMQSLLSGKIAGAALDVFWKEPVPQDHPLLKLDNVVITPHIAGMGDQVFSRGSKMIVDGMMTFFASGKPSNVVNPEVLDSAVLSGRIGR